MADTLLEKRNVLIPVDDTEDSTKAVQWCLDNFYRDGDELHLFHVIPTPMPEVIGGIGGVEVEEARAFLHKRFVPALEAKQAAYKLEIVRFMTDADSIGEAVTKRASAINAAAIIIQSHNKGSLKEFFLGSVSKYTSTHATSAVIVLH